MHAGTMSGRRPRGRGWASPSNRQSKHILPMLGDGRHARALDTQCRRAPRSLNGPIRARAPRVLARFFGRGHWAGLILFPDLGVRIDVFDGCWGLGLWSRLRVAEAVRTMVLDTWAGLGRWCRGGKGDGAIAKSRKGWCRRLDLRLFRDRTVHPRIRRNCQPGRPLLVKAARRLGPRNRLPIPRALAPSQRPRRRG